MLNLFWGAGGDKLRLSLPARDRAGSVISKTVQKPPSSNAYYKGRGRRQNDATSLEKIIYFTFGLYTVFKSKWQIVNLCSSKTTSPKTFKFSVNVGNNWPFCHAKTQILLLNSLGSVKITEYAQFLRAIFFLLLYLRRLVFIKIQVLKKWSYNTRVGLKW